MIKAVVVDDEQISRQTVIEVVQTFCEDVKVIGSAGSVDEALGVLKTVRPDVLFLDVEMGNKSGFNLLEELGEVNFDVIFVTAYDQYAIRAIKFCALEYLLKPIEVDELQEAVEKVRINMREKQAKHNFSHLLDNLRVNAPSDLKIAIPVSEGYRFVKISEILYFEADGSYCKLHLDGQKTMTVSKSLKYFENLLEDPRFLRIHNSYFINLDFVTTYLKGDGGEVIMTNKSSLSVSRSKKEPLLNKLKLKS